jgi:spermidine synthase
MWSPYYRFDVSPFYYSEAGKSILIGHTVAVNKAFFQQPLNLSHNLLQSLGKDSQLQKFLVSQYDMPYLFLHPEKVLVLGCGTGNDVAAAIRNGAQKVVGVEIDPLMVKLGKKIHPEHPYDSPKVETVINDARAFLRQSDYKADLILTGLLDSHTVAGNSLSVRLDDYVYTVNGMRDAMSHLTPDGVYTISFCAPQDFIIKRLLNNLKAATNNDPARKPLVLVMEGSAIYHIFTPVTPALISKLADLKKLGFKEMTFDHLDEVRTSTDDWPYLYLAPALFDPVYLAINGILIAFAWLACGSKIRRNVSARRWHLFFMGSAFLLLELAVIDRLALIFGTTWFVNSFCIFAILGAIILSNILIIRYPKMFVPNYLYAGLFISLITLYFVPIENLSSLSFILSASIGGVLSAIPIFFAGLIFSGAYSREQEPSVGLAFNMFGAVIGGLMEYAAIYTGIKALLLIALGFYVISLLCYKSGKDSVAPV